MRSIFNINSPKLAQDLVWVLEKAKTKIVLPSQLCDRSKVQLIYFIDDFIAFLKA